jgi:hypothetical protein
VFGSPFFCQKRLIIPPRIFKSGKKKIDLDPLPKEKMYAINLCFTAPVTFYFYKFCTK